MKRILSLCLLLASAAVLAQSPAGRQPTSHQTAGPTSAVKLAAKAQAAYETQDYASYLAFMKKLRRKRPYDGQVMYKLAEAYALNGKKEEAFNLLVRMQQQGLAFNPKGDEDFASIDQYQLFSFLVKRLKKNNNPFNKATLAFTVEQTGLLPEGIAYSASKERFYIGSVRHGSVWRVSKDGEADVFIEPGTHGLSAVLGLAVDEERGVLWVASSMVPQYEGYEPGADPSAALYRFDLETGEFSGRYPIENQKLKVVLSNIAVADDGSVYVTNAARPVIYRWQPEDDFLKPFIGSPRMTSLQGLAISPNGQYLFVTDYTRGLFRIRLADRRVIRIGHGPRVNLGGLHDIDFHGTDLIVVQTGTRPPRVVRLALSDDLTRVTAQQPLSANQPAYNELGQGVVVGDSFYFIANAQWSAYGEGGSVKEDAELEPVKVLKADTELGGEVLKKPSLDRGRSAAPEDGSATDAETTEADRQSEGR